jgi:hypothetical protein
MKTKIFPSIKPASKQVSANRISTERKNHEKIKVPPLYYYLLTIY